MARYTVTTADVAASNGNVANFCLLATSSSLCANTSAAVTVERNGPDHSGDLNNGDIVAVSAKEGDVLTITVTLEPRSNNIDCIRLGDTRFALVR